MRQRTHALPAPMPTESILTRAVPAEYLIAHRGWQRRYPENTAAAIQGAIAAGARAVEIDVQLSADGIPVLHHDRSLWRLCRRRGRVADYAWSELASLRASEPDRFGQRFAAEPLLRLDHLVELLQDHPQVHLFLEAKAEALERFPAQQAIDAMLEAAAPLRDRCTLISFSFPMLRAARQRGWPQLGPVLRRWAQLSSRAVNALHPSVVFVNARLLPPRGPIVSPWPLAVYEIDQPEMAQSLLKRGVRWVESFAIGELLGAAPVESEADASTSGEAR